MNIKKVQLEVSVMFRVTNITLCSQLVTAPLTPSLIFFALPSLPFLTIPHHSSPWLLPSPLPFLQPPPVFPASLTIPPLSLYPPPPPHPLIVPLLPSSCFLSLLPLSLPPLSPPPPSLPLLHQLSSSCLPNTDSKP